MGIFVDKFSKGSSAFISLAWSDLFVTMKTSLFEKSDSATMRVKYICVTDEAVYEIPFYQIKGGKFPRRELASQTVIMMEMTYETKNRRPFTIIRIVFERVTFDKHGIYDARAVSDSEEFAVKRAYTLSQLDEITDPLPIPIAPVILTEIEINAIKAYLNRKYPALLKNAPSAIEEWIAVSKEKHVAEIKQMKVSHRK